MPSDSSDTELFESGGVAVRRLAPGAVLAGRYHLEAELGRGGMGVVFRATDSQLRREVAVKVLPETGSSSDARERLLSEARAAAALNHPNIVAVHDVGEDHGAPFFVMELVAGTSLGKEPPKELTDVVEIACQICAALGHAHAHGIVHRDLKPENVLLSGSGPHRVVKLADLGLAIAPTGARITNAGSIVGTVAYMAPEQALGEPVDGRTDLYSLGVVLYELTTGRLPFLGDHPLAVVSQHVNAPVVPPRALRPDLPRALEAVILRLLVKQPHQRYDTAEAVAHALREAILTDSDGQAPAEPEAALALLDALARGRLVGRAEELGEVRELWRRAREGRGHAVLLTGEPGSGKTRLAREMLTQAAIDGATVLTGGCYEFEATTPYLPFAEAFRQWVRRQKDDAKLAEMLGEAAPQIAKLVPEVAARLGPFAQRTELSAHEERLMFFDAVVGVLRAIAASRSVLLCLDDLHWADGGTLWLLGHLLRNLKDERVLVMGAYREIELDRSHPLSKSLVEWNRERLTTRIVLRRFGKDETRAQLAALLGQDPGPDFAGAVHEETEGNPFFVEEVLKALIEQGAVRREDGRWSRDEIRDMEIPQSVKAAIGHRLDRASPECNEVLRAAAILGKSFDFAELAAAASDRGEDALLDALDEAVSAQLLIAGRDESFVFTHDKIREVLYEEMNPIRRRRLHLRTVEGLERHREKAPVAVETLAHHAIEGGDHERGLRYAKEAAAEAEKLFAFDEALAAYSRAAECAEALGRTDEVAAIEEAMGLACSASGNFIEGAQHFERALVLTTDPPTRARLQCEAAASYVTTGDPKGLAHLESALAVLDAGTKPIETAFAMAIQGRFSHLRGQHRKAADLLEEAASIAERAIAGGPLTILAGNTMTQIYAYLSGAYQHQGLLVESDRWAQRCIAFGRAHGLPLAEASGYEFLGENASGTGEFAAGLEHAAREREIADRIHSRERRAWTYIYAAWCHLQRKEYEDAEREVVEGLALSSAIGEKRLHSLLSAAISWVRMGQGRLDEALELALAALADAEAIGLLYMRTEARRALAMVRLARAEYAEVEKLADEVDALTAGTDAKVSRVWIGVHRIEALIEAGRKEAATEHLAAYRRLLAECQMRFHEREADRLEARLAKSSAP